MRLVDTHCHLDFPEYKDDLEKVIENAHAQGVVRMIIPGAHLASSKKAIEIAREYDSVFSAAGIHPHDADKFTEKELQEIEKLAKANTKVVAIGEIGLDYYRKNSTPDNQKKMFEEFLKLAERLDLPVILHQRDAEEDFLRILKETNLQNIKGVVHCFSGDKEFLKKMLKMGLYISFTGVITFKKADELKSLIELVPPEKLLLETDSPYMAPVPFRGKRNEPAFVKELIGVYSQIFEISEEDIARIATHNANELFSLGLEEEGKIAYAIRDNLYLNITNECTNNCSFCTRNSSNFVKGHNLKLKAEPSIKDIIEAMGDISGYKEIVFCGFGEPTLRLDVIKEIASYAKKNGKRVRLVTNGEGDLINSRPIVPEIKGLVDIVSVSLNAPDEETFDNICHSNFGKKAFGAIISFIKECSFNGIEVEITCLDFIGEEGIEKTRSLIEGEGVRFRLRHLNVVG